MGKFALFLLVLVVGGNGFSQSVLHARWPLIKTKSVDIDHFEDVDSMEIEPRLFCTCGVNKLSKMIGGEDASPKEYPWMAALCHNGTCSDLTYFCGGSLINDQYILTVAHCLVGKEATDVTVSLGDNKLSSAEATQYQVEEIFIHEDYDLEMLIMNDIALIKLSTKVKMSDKINPVCLPPRIRSYIGETAYLPSWGEPQGTSGPASDTLKEASLKVLSKKECRRLFSSPSEMSFEAILCGKAKESSICRGDAGGPFLYRDSNGYYEQIGVSMGGMECKDFLYPALFSELNKYLDFIAMKTKDAQYCAEKPQK